MNESTKNVFDLVSLGAALGAFVELLTPLAALASLIWTGIRIYEYVKGKQNGNQRNDKLDS